MRTEFIAAIKANQSAFGIDLADNAIERLADYYELILEHNPILHLVGPCSPEEFAIRHILESLTLLEYLPPGVKFADVGAGAGLPSIACLLVRTDLKAVVIESKNSKAGFLRTVLAKCKLTKRAHIFDRQFAELRKPDFTYVTCRAIDKFTEKLPQLLRWSGNCTLILFGGKSLREGLVQAMVKFEEKLLPMSEQRYLFYVSRTTEKVI
jgi:16S rRNA (guanine527-N7)-methyltransferase